MHCGSWHNIMIAIMIIIIMIVIVKHAPARVRKLINAYTESPITVRRVLSSLWWSQQPFVTTTKENGEASATTLASAACTLHHQDQQLADSMGGLTMGEATPSRAATMPSSHITLVTPSSSASSAIVRL